MEEEKIFQVRTFLKRAVASGASDIHLMAGEPPFIRKNGNMMRVNNPSLQRVEITNALLEITPPTLLSSFNTMKDIDFMFEIPGCSRFRVNYCRGLGMPEVVMRVIPYNIPSLDDLGLPKVISDFKQLKNGIVLITGPIGSGKSTTLASLIEELNTQTSKHIITIEDPVEYVYTSKKSRITQRVVGADTETFASGLKAALRQDPDVILVGEIRDRETMDIALKAAETGHLVLATLHTNDAVQSINRMINMFDEANRDLVRKQISETLRATVAQQLVYSSKDQKRYPACEVMVVTSTIKDYIVKDELEEVYSLIDSNSTEGMVSMNKSLADLVEEEKLTQDEAMAASTDPDDLSKVFRGAY